MTYTFKLARRLAMSRDYAMYACLLLVAACAGDATSPDEGSPVYRETVGFRVVPKAVTIETNQPIRFRGEADARFGDTPALRISWEASGGTMAEDGTFSAVAPGRYEIVGRGRRRIGTDTSVVLVIAPLERARAIVVAPDTVTLGATATHAFTATKRLFNGNSGPVAVHWKATGGTVDEGGVYTAADKAGTYHVIATTIRGTLADTATVRVLAADLPPEPPSGPSEPAPPTLEQVHITPASVLLTVGATKQFTASGRNSVGDSVAVGVTFSATGGSVSSSGLYTAGTQSGVYRVVATADGLADTAVVTLTPPTAPSPGVGGIAFGSFHLPRELYGTGGLSGALRGLSLSTAATELAAARAKRARLVVSLVGAPPEYENADGTFNLSRWKSQLDRWRPYASLLKEYYENGTIILHYVVDEPGCAMCWGGRTISHAALQEMTRYSKELFPFLPTTIRVIPGWLKSTPSWPHLDAAWAQYEGPLHQPSYRMTPEQFRDQSVADARQIGVALVLGLNTLDGGDGSSGINGTFAQDPYLGDPPSARYRYQMSAEEFERAGKAFAATAYNCAVLNWRYSPSMSRSPSYVQQFDLRDDVQAAAQRIGAVASARAAKSCQKPGS